MFEGDSKRNNEGLGDSGAGPHLPPRCAAGFFAPRKPNMLSAFVNWGKKGGEQERSGGSSPSTPGPKGRGMPNDMQSVDLLSEVKKPTSAAIAKGGLAKPGYWHAPGLFQFVVHAP